MFETKIKLTIEQDGRIRPQDIYSDILDEPRIGDVCQAISIDGQAVAMGANVRRCHRTHHNSGQPRYCDIVSIVFEFDECSTSSSPHAFAAVFRVY